MTNKLAMRVSALESGFVAVVAALAKRDMEQPVIDHLDFAQREIDRGKREPSEIAAAIRALLEKL